MALLMGFILLAGCGTKPEEGVAAMETAENEITLSDDASDFVLVSDVVPDAILEIRYYSTYNFVGDRINGYEEPLAFLTKEAAQALKEVSDDVRAKGYRLKIYDAYQSLCGMGKERG